MDSRKTEKEAILCITFTQWLKVRYPYPNLFFLWERHFIAHAHYMKNGPRKISKIDIPAPCHILATDT